jgi:uncharacterized protein involved in outer membrane biogenesis
MSLSRRAKRVLGGVLGTLLLAYALAGFFLVPRVARSQIEAFVTDTLHRKIEIGDIRFNPFTLAVTITDLKLSEADGAPLVAFQRLYVNAELASLWRRGVVLKEIDLAAPDVEIIVAPDGQLNLAALAPPPGPAPAPPKADDKPLRVEVGRFAVADGRVGFQDRSQAQPFSAAFTPIRFSLTDFSTDVGHSNAYSFTTASRLGAKFEWSGAFTVQPLGSSGTFGVSDLRLAAVDDYLESLPVEIASGSIDFHGSYRFALQPLALHVVLPSIGVRDLVLAERGVAAAPPVTVPQIDVQDLVFSLSRRDVGLRRLDVRGARIEVVREKDGSLNLARLAPPASPPPAQPVKPQAPWTVHAETIAIEAATVIAEDRSTSPAARMQLTPIGITVSGFSTARATRMKLGAQVGIDGKGHLGVQGEVGMDPLNVALALDLQRFPLPALQPYLTQSTGLVLHSGSLGVKGKLALAAGRAGAPPAANVAVDVKIDDVRATDDLVREDLVKWRSLAISGIRFQQRPDRLAIDRIVAQEPYARIIVAQNGTTNISRALAPPAGSEPAAKPPPAKPPAGTAAPSMPITIRSVQVVDGSANFADYSVQPSFAAGIVGLGGEITGLSSAPESRAKVGLAGQIDQYSPVEINGEINVLSADVYTDLAVKFSNIELTTFNPYSGKFAGYNISKGKLSTAMKYHVEQRKLDAQHHIVVDNLEFGDKTDSKDAAPIPIQLGVALLKDRRGMIEVDLPIGGTLDDPQFHIGAVIGKAILNLLVKVIALPFKAIGAMFGGGDELAFVDFQPGSAVLGEPEAKKLGTLSKALVERPQLRLDVPFTAVAAAADGEAMAAQALRALVPPADPAKPLDDAAKRKRIDALEAAYRAQLKTAAEYPKEMQGDEAPQLDAKMAWLQAALLERLKPAPAALEALGKQRAGAVRDALLANKELKPERVFIVSKPKEIASPAGAVRLEMELK